MKQILFCYKKDRGLFIRQDLLTDVFVPVQDIISPQKTTLELPLTRNVEISDIIIIRDNETSQIEYIGYIDTIETEDTTEISCYPLMNIFDNDFILDQIYKEVKNEDDSTAMIDVDIVEWLMVQLRREFVNTEDEYQALPLIIRDKTNGLKLYKKIVDTANLFDIYTDIFINTGVYVTFSGLEFERNKISGIYCDIYCNKDKEPLLLRYDNPKIQKVSVVDNTFKNQNKLIVTTEVSEEDQALGKKPEKFVFYLLNNNDITTESDDGIRIARELAENLPIGSLGRRIKQVRSKAITISLSAGDDEEYLTEEQKKEKYAKNMLLAVYNELQDPEYDLRIEIDMFKTDNVYLYRSINFLAQSGVTYTSNITKIEVLSDKQIRVTLGALRNSLTDFKKRVEEI